MPPAKPLEEPSMRPSWKLALIGGEVTVLAAFTGVGIHLAMQPHRIAFRPPPLVLPSTRPAVIPSLAIPLVPVPRPTPPSASPPGLGPELFRKFGQQDHDLAMQEWDMLTRLTGAIERYVEAQIAERFPKKR
ncbi:MAG TPA: hypothetical protein VJT14_13220 [Candidatus Dormibacteraeota bacterium]|nr:hypothetical protein [Candidatus Dormibacteraeota bacterium]